MTKKYKGKITLNPPKDHPIFKLGVTVSCGGGGAHYRRALLRQKLKLEAIATGRPFDLVLAEYDVLYQIPKWFDAVDIEQIRLVGIERWPHWEAVLAGIGDQKYRRDYASMLASHSAALERLRCNPPAPAAGPSHAGGEANATTKTDTDSKAQQQAGETGKGSE